MFERAGLSYRRTVASIAAAGIAVASTALIAGAAPPAGAAPRVTYKVTAFGIDVVSVKVKSTTRTSLRYTVTVGSGSAGASRYTVNLGLSRGTESHYWGFRLAKSALKVNAATGTGSIDTRSLLKKYGRLRLKVTPAGKAKRQTYCSYTGGYVTSRPVKLTGTPRFNTNSGKHGWGLVGTRKVTLRATLTTTYGSPTPHCPTGPTYCESVGVSIYHGVSNESVDASSAGKKPAYIAGSRSVVLASPKGASRYDVVDGSGPALKAVKSAGALSVKVSGSSKAVTGSATLTSSGSPYVSTCKATSNSSYSGTWKNGSKKLTFHEAIEGSFSVGNAGYSSLEVITKS